MQHAIVGERIVTAAHASVDRVHGLVVRGAIERQLEQHVIARISRTGVSIKWTSFDDVRARFGTGVAFVGLAVAEVFQRSHVRGRIVLRRPSDDQRVALQTLGQVVELARCVAAEVGDGLVGDAAAVQVGAVALAIEDGQRFDGRVR